MQNGRWYIDGVDIYAAYGVGIENGGYDDLLGIPPMKTPAYNDWHEMDGNEVDLEDPKLENRSVSIPFVSGNPHFDHDFIFMLSEPGYRSLYIPSLGKTWELRLSSENNIELWRTGQRHVMEFYDDTPRRFIAEGSPVGSGINIPKALYSIDGISLDQYGLLVKTARSSVFKMPTIKKNLETDISVIDGKIVSTLSANMSAKEVDLDLCFYAKSLELFWANYSAFFYNLTKPGERIFYVSESEEEFPCFYNKMSGFDFYRNGDDVICEFNLTLTFITFRIGEADYLLATEDGMLIVLEDGETFVDMEK